MQDKDRTVPKAFRITESTADKFKEIAQEIGGNQQQTLARLIEVYEAELGRESMPEMRESIDTFEGYVRAATNMYMQALESNQNMRALVRTEYEGQLKSKDMIIEDLQAKVTEAQQTAKIATDAEESYLAMIDKLKTDNYDLSVKLNSEKEDFNRKNDDWNHKYDVLNEKYQKLQDAEQEFRQLIGTLMKEKDKLTEENTRLQEQRDSINANIAELTYTNKSISAELKAYKTQVEEEQQRQEKAQQQYKKQLETENRLAIKELENELKEKHREEIDKLRTELDKYKELYYHSINAKS